MLKLKLQYFGHLMRRVDSFEKTLMRGGIGGRRRRGQQRMRDGWMASLTRWTWVWINSGSWWWTGRPGVLQFMGLQRVGHDWATELNWVYMINIYIYIYYAFLFIMVYHRILNIVHLLFIHSVYISFHLLTSNSHSIPPPPCFTWKVLVTPDLKCVRALMERLELEWEDS